MGVWGVGMGFGGRNGGLGGTWGVCGAGMGVVGPKGTLMMAVVASVFRVGWWRINSSTALPRLEAVSPGGGEMGGLGGTQRSGGTPNIGGGHGGVWGPGRGRAPQVWGWKP